MMRIIALLLAFSFTSHSFAQFIKAKGRHIMSGKDTFMIKGVCFGNEVWTDKIIPDTHHNEEDYKRVAALGMNTIRFYLNYKTFEDDQNPYTYKKEGWDWLDKNLAWAKKNNIYLILNMHAPQGGYQSQGKGNALWRNKSNQSRLTKLWRAIANRYADEPTILGYDILNEPCVPDSIGQWKSYAKTLVNNIRKVDKNHLIIVERTNAVKGKWTNNEAMNFFKIEDDNILYTFHFYNPIEYSHQNTSWSSFGDGGSYPDENRLEYSGDLYWYSCNSSNTQVHKGTTKWTFYEGELFKITDDFIKVAKPVLVAKNSYLGVKFGSFTIKEYDPRGKFIRDIMNIDPTKEKGWGFWSKSGKGSFEILYNDGVENKDVLYIKRTNSDANCYNNGLRFVPKQNYFYQISGWAKGYSVSDTTKAMFRLDFESQQGDLDFHYRNKQYLEDEFNKFLAFGEQHNVPLYVGEIGLYNDCFKRGKGGLKWYNDILDIMLEKKLHFTLHAWHEDAFGLYYGYGQLPNEKDKNKKLLKLIDSKLH